MNTSEQPSQSLQSRLLKVNNHHIRWAIVVLVVAMIVTAFFLRGEFDDVEGTVRSLGYPAVFVAALVGSAGMVIPLPSTAAIFFGGDILNPVYVGLLAGFAEGMGEITGYGLGFSGQPVIRDTRLYRQLEGWVQRRGWTVIFVVSIIPNPVFDVLGIAAGALRLPLPKFLAAAWAGKTIKNLGIACAGYLGAGWVKDWIGLV